MIRVESLDMLFVPLNLTLNSSNVRANVGSKRILGPKAMLIPP
jgi:hypothetical protein